MKLSALCHALCGARTLSALDPEITGLTNDSRRVKSGHLFVAVSGYRQDGHAFVPDAVARGAAAVVMERPIALPRGVAGVLVQDGRAALSALGHRFFGEPSTKLEVCGVTGTKGKTTTASLIHAISEAARCPTGLLGTVAYRIGPRQIPAFATTPESVYLHDYLSQMLQAGLKRAVVEVSSHALVMKRVSHVRFRAAVLTNVAPHEHTDFHGSFEHYRAAKSLLFSSLSRGQIAVLNRDDEHYAYFRERTGAEVITYGTHRDAHVQAQRWHVSMAGTSFRIRLLGRDSFDVTSPLVGEHNVSNILAATATALALGTPESAIQRGLAGLSQVAGRLEPVYPGRDFSVWVDYAHTADSLKCVLTTLNRLARGRVIVVFGCGGDRDRSKRPLMARAASELAGFCWITSDNSRSERTEDIIRDIERGLVRRDRHHTCPDRAEAIRGAVDMAQPGDIVLLAGKGHETTQTLGDVTFPFDDRLVARDAVARRRAREQGPLSSVAAL